MSGQTFRENIEQEVDDLFHRYLVDKDVHEVGVSTFYDGVLPLVVDWAVERFGEEER